MHQVRNCPSGFPKQVLSQEFNNNNTNNNYVYLTASPDKCQS